MSAQKITDIKGVGDAMSSKLSKLGIKSIPDLVDYVPFRYDDFSEVTRVNDIRPGLVTLKVTLGAAKGRYSRRGLHMTECLASDESGSVRLIWFNQPYRANSIKPGSEYFVSGEFASNHRYFAITNPACELVSKFPVNTARMVPIYRLTKGLGATQLRKAVKHALEMYKPLETLPNWLIKQEDLMPRIEALKQMHFPDSNSKLAEAKKRLGFEEVFELTLAAELNKADRADYKSFALEVNKEAVSNFVSSLPFKITNDQRKVAWEILQDMTEGSPMNRLIEGDVGSGKTAVAAIAAVNVVASGLQVALMAPTELLARQHERSLINLFSKLHNPPEVLFLSGSINKTDRQAPLNKIKQSSGQIVVGTHALFQESVKFNNLGLVIVDEQHRFGVEQRKALQAKANKMPHVLHMTATPIPRSLALTLYGELDISRIEQLPEGRKPIGTYLMTTENRQKMYQKIAEHVKESKEQVYVVCPQIDEGVSDRSNATKVFNELSSKWLKTLNVSLLHGRMKADEKDQIMAEFADGKVDVLVATTVIEVGVDVPNSTTMVIESADSFGLAQLHQLRGRVGRGSSHSRSYLVLSDNEAPKKRLELMTRENSGFVLSEFDLEERGPGAIYGKAQSGALDLRVAKLTDRELINSAKACAIQFIEMKENLLEYKQLHDRVNELRKIVNLN